MSLFRKHPTLDIALYFGTRFFPPEVREALRGKRQYKYIVWSHGGIIKQSDKFETAEDAYLAECELRGSPDSVGSFKFGQHTQHFRGHLVRKADYVPDKSWTVADIRTWLFLHHVPLRERLLKADLLKIVAAISKKRRAAP